MTSSVAGKVRGRVAGDGSLVEARLSVSSPVSARAGLEWTLAAIRHANINVREGKII